MKRLLAFVGLAGSLAACTLLSPLEYLQNGGPIAADGGDAEAGDDGGSEMPPTVVADKLDFPGALALDDTDVYFAASTSALLAVPKQGGTPRTVTALTAVIVKQLAVDGDLVWYTNEKTVSSVPKAGGTPSVVYTATAPIQGFALDATSLYVGEADDTNAVYAVTRIAKAGGQKTILDDGTALPSAIGVDDASVFWADGTNLVIRQVAKSAIGDGGVEAGTLGNENDPIDVGGQGSFVAEANAFFYADTTGALSRHLRQPGVLGQVLYSEGSDTTTAAALGPIAVDAANAWFYSPGKQAVLRVSKTGGDAKPIASKLVGLRGMAVDGASLYFTIQGTDPQTGSVLKLPTK